MPTYIFRNTETGEVIESIMSISAREDYLKQNPHMITVIQSPMIVSGVSTSNSKRNKVPAGFKEVLSKVGQAHPSSPVADNYYSKSIKEIKTRQIVKKHVNKMIKEGQ